MRSLRTPAEGSALYDGSPLFMLTANRHGDNSMVTHVFLRYWAHS